MKRTAAMPSSYYPPRARGGARWWSPVQRLRRQMQLLAQHLPRPPAVMELFLSLLIPGHVFHRMGWRRVGRGIMTGCAVAALVFVVWLGRPLADWSFLALISAHVASLSQLIQSRLATQRLLVQMAIGTILFTAATVVIYLPARNFFYQHVAMPLQTADRVVVVNTLTRPGQVRRGDVIGYRIDGDYSNGVVLRSGYGFGPVLAVAGDRVQFTAEAVRINGAAWPRQHHMPERGELIVPERHWFIWPELRISNINYGQSAAAAEMLRLAQVDESQFVGRPFKRWFFWKQTLP